MPVTSTHTFVRDDGKFEAAWTGFATSGDTGAGFKVPRDVSSLTFHGFGTFTGSLSLQIQGSNDEGTTWTDLGLTAITAAAFRTTALIPDLVRVAATAGTGGANAAVHCIGQRG